MKRLAIVGGGSWGTALAIALAPRFASTSLWVHDAARAGRFEQTRVNETYLPGFALPGSVQVTSHVQTALHSADAVVLVTPSHHLREIFTQALPYLPREVTIVSAVKGIENGTLLRMTEVLHSVGGVRPIAVLSGPSFAREVAAGKPVAMVAASQVEGLAEIVQNAFSTASLRIYASADVIGVEMGGALKNVIALAAGVATGLGLGHSSLAALITRGLAEMTRVSLALGASAATLSGLTGLGDLVLTCTGELSRNRQVGLELAKGRSIAEITASMRMVAEGVKTTASAMGLARRLGIEMPIAEQMEAVLNGKRAAPDALRLLMERRLKEE